MIAGVLVSIFEPSSAWAAETTPPRLSIVGANGNSLVLAWPASASGFRLKTTTSLSSPVQWMPVAEQVLTAGGTNHIEVTALDAARFYRLDSSVDYAGLMLNYATALAADSALQGVASDLPPEFPFLDRFNPHRLTPLTALPTGPNGDLLGLRGLTEAWLESYCLRVGAPAPGGGDGYLPVAFRGPRGDIVKRVVESAITDPLGSRETRQLLLWAIILRAHPTALPPEVQALAQRVLTADDLQRLEAAAAAKDAIEADYTQRIIEAYLGPGGLLSGLPDSIRETLLTDGEFEQALANSTTMSFEEMQNLAFTAQLIEQPYTPVREIPFGRWAWVPSAADPPAGYFARYQPSWYAETLVQFYRPEELTIEEDDLGRITAIWDGLGNRIETAYDDNIPPLTFSEDAGAKGYAFASIRFVGPPDREDPRLLPSATFAATGWVLVGTPGGSAGSVAVTHSRYPDAPTRYRWTHEHVLEVERLDAELSRVHPVRPAGGAAMKNLLTQLAGYTEALRLALLEAVTDTDPEWELTDDWLGLAYRAWASSLGGYAVGVAPARAASLQHAAPALGRRWKTPQAAEVFETVYAQLRANGTAQDLALAKAKTEAAKADARQTWKDYKDWTSRVVDTCKRLHSIGGVQIPWTVPLTVFLPILDVTVQVWNWAGLKLATVDPPRDDYTALAGIVVPDPGPVPEVSGVSARRLAAARALLPLQLRLAAVLHSAMVTYDRVGGAIKAGDAIWAARQATLYAELMHEAGRAMLDNADALEEWVLVLREEGVEDAVVTAAEVAESRQLLRDQGFTANEITAIRQFGLTDGEIEELRQALLAAPIDPEDRWMLGTIEETIPVLRERGRRLMEIGVASIAPSQQRVESHGSLAEPIKWKARVRSW